MAPFRPYGQNELNFELPATPALSVKDKMKLQVAVMESYGIHHDAKHPNNPLSMKWVEHGAASAFRDLLDEKDLTPEDVQEVERIKAFVLSGNLEHAVKHCHELLSKKFTVESSLKTEDESGEK